MGLPYGKNSFLLTSTVIDWFTVLLTDRQTLPTACAVIFYASENTNCETAKSPEIIKYTHQMHNAHQYFNLEICSELPDSAHYY